MNTKAKGTNAERTLINKFWATGKWAAVRVAGSGSMHFPACDIIASNKIRRCAVECKITKDDKKYLEKEDVTQLKNFAEYFGAEGWFAVRFFRSEWFFLSIEDVEEKDNSYLISKELAERKGLSFEEFIGDIF